MSDRMYYKNCSYISTYKRVPSIYNSYEIILKVKTDNDFIGTWYRVRLDSNNLEHELSKLINKETDRILFTYGMADIDIWYDKHNNKYVIIDSPIECKYNYLYLSEEEFMNLYNDIKDDNRKFN